MREEQKALTIRMATNVEYITELMEHSEHGSLVQAFIVESIIKYSQQVIDEKPQWNNGFISSEVWLEIAKEVQSKMILKYGQFEKGSALALGE